MANIEFSSNIKQIADAIATKKGKILKTLNQGMFLGVTDWQKMMDRTELTGRPGLNVKTGNLRNQFIVERVGSGAESAVRVGFTANAWYAKVHQHYNFDGTIRAKNGKYLAIPLTSAAAKRWPRQWPQFELQRRGRALGTVAGAKVAGKIRNPKFTPM